jgi:hypothetical protein
MQGPCGGCVVTEVLKSDSSEPAPGEEGVTLKCLSASP